MATSAIHALGSATRAPRRGHRPRAPGPVFLRGAQPELDPVHPGLLGMQQRVFDKGARRMRRSPMAYVIAEPCIDTKDNSCVEVCPVDCIHPTPDEPDYDQVKQLYIDPRSASTATPASRPAPWTPASRRTSCPTSGSVHPDQPGVLQAGSYDGFSGFRGSRTAARQARLVLRCTPRSTRGIPAPCAREAADRSSARSCGDRGRRGAVAIQWSGAPPPTSAADVIRTAGEGSTRRRPAATGTQSRRPPAKIPTLEPRTVARAPAPTPPRAIAHLAGRSPPRRSRPTVPRLAPAKARDHPTSSPNLHRPTTPASRCVGRLHPPTPDEPTTTRSSCSHRPRGVHRLRRLRRGLPGDACSGASCGRVAA